MRPAALPREPDIPRYYRIASVARRLDHSRQSVYSAVKRGELRAVKIFGSLRVSEADVLTYLEKCRGRR